MGYTTKNLREYRMEQGLSMSELSYKAKITASQISLLEKQKIKKPQASTIRKLAEQFKEENQSLMCRDLLAFCKKAQQPMERTDAYYAERPCTRLVMDAARLLDNLIAERGLNK